MVHDDIRGAYGTGRMTPQRRLIATTAAAMPGAFTTEMLAEAVRDIDAATGVATVYRAVAALLTSGWIERVGERDGRAQFVRCHAGSDHHHHVICEGCGRVETTACPISVTLGEPGADAFRITRHDVTLYGLCPACAATADERLA